jgi:HEPN domain-containing protein
MNQHDTEQPKTVIDDKFDDYTKPQLFFRLAIAYADCSHQLFVAMLSGLLPQTFGHAQAGHFLFDHAIELFLKGAILRSTGKIEITHNLEPLYNKYRKLYCKEEYGFAARIAEAIRRNPASPHSEFPRYPVDACGNIWDGYNAYTLETWLKEAEHLRSDLAHIIPKIDPLPPPALS